jgi:acetolactate synthase I/II/III large subunit
MMRVADTVARGLAAAGVRHAFGMPGGEVVTLVDALADAGIRFVLARHETAAAIMAAGAAAVTGAPGLLVTTLGPASPTQSTAFPVGFRYSARQLDAG